MFSLDKDDVLIKSIIFFSVLGAFISFLFSVIGGSGFPAILYQPFLSALVMALITAVGYFIIKKFAPALLNFENLETDIKTDDLSSSGDINKDTSDENLDQSDDYESLTSDENEEWNTKTTNSKNIRPAEKSTPRRTAGEGEILVEGVPIKNEPKLMAEAIQHLISKDE